MDMQTMTRWTCIALVIAVVFLLLHAGSQALGAAMQHSLAGVQ
jgi:hypothetical protein